MVSRGKTKNEYIYGIYITFSPSIKTVLNEKKRKKIMRQIDNVAAENCISQTM